MNAIRHCFNNFKLETKLSANKIRHLKFEICFKKSLETGLIILYLVIIIGNTSSIWLYSNLLRRHFLQCK